MHDLRRPPHITISAGLILLAGCGSDGTGPSTDRNITLGLGGQHACHSDQTGTRCWGAGSEGQLGIGLTPSDTTPTELPGTPVFNQLVGGSLHTCGLEADGRAYCWGSNANGQLGTTSELEQCPLPCATTARPVAGDLTFRALAAGRGHTCGITTSGSAYCWGLNDLGQLGTTVAGESCIDGPCFRVPTAVQTQRTFTSVTAAFNHSCARQEDGGVFCWGFQAGTTEGGNRIPQYRPEVTALAGGLVFRQISAGGWHTCGVTDAGTAYCWGIDAIGAGPSPLESDAPVAVGGGHQFRSVHSAGNTSCGLDQNGVAYCWGANSNGAVGREPVGSTIRFDLPSLVSGGLRFTHLAPGTGTYCGATTSEDIMCWGRGSSGELGIGHEDSATPVSVPGL